MPLPTMSDTMLKAVADWLNHVGEVPDEFDVVRYQSVTDDLMRAALGQDGAIRRPEGRAALVKVLAASLSMTVYDGTDEDVFRVVERVRGDLYAEIMKFRRAVARDVRREEF